MPKQGRYLRIGNATGQSVCGEGMAIAVSNAVLHLRLQAQLLKPHPDCLGRQLATTGTFEQQPRANGFRSHLRYLPCFALKDEESGFAVVGRLMLRQRNHAIHRSPHLLGSQPGNLSRPSTGGPKHGEEVTHIGLG